MPLKFSDILSDRRKSSGFQIDVEPESRLVTIRLYGNTHLTETFDVFGAAVAHAVEPVLGAFTVIASYERGCRTPTEAEADNARSVHEGLKAAGCMHLIRVVRSADACDFTAFDAAVAEIELRVSSAPDMSAARLMAGAPSEAPPCADDPADAISRAERCDTDAHSAA